MASTVIQWISTKVTTTQLQHNYANCLFINSRESLEIRKRKCMWWKNERLGDATASICVIPRAIFPPSWGTEAYLKQRGWRNINDARKGYWRHRVVPLDLINLPLLEEHNTRVNVDATCHRWNIKVERRGGVAAILSIIPTTNNACTYLRVEPFKHRKIYLNWL